MSFFKPVFNGKYSISSDGVLKRNTSQRLLKYSLTKGYYRVTVCDGPLRVNRNIHSLVAEAFFGPRPKGHVVNHKNGIKTDNRVENLEYTTVKGNTDHAFEMKLRSPHANRKLTDLQIKEIKSLIPSWTRKTTTLLCLKFGVSRSTIDFIRSGRRWND